MNNEIIDALSYIDPSRLTYEEWVQVGMALKEAGCDWVIWDSWSQTDIQRYHDGECERKWKSFHGSPSPITEKTVFRMARERGYKPNGRLRIDNGQLGWEDTITADTADNCKLLIDNCQFPQIVDSPTEQFALYLRTLFEPDDHVSYVVESWQDKDGKWKPSRSGSSDRTAAQLLAELEHYPDDLGAVLGDWNPEAGAWIRFNAMDGKGAKNENVTSFRYALVESDSMTEAQQFELYQKLELPIAALVSSAGKSLHAIVRVDAKTCAEYRQRVNYLYDFLAKNGCSIDRQNSNPSRLSRLPGVTRGGRMQSIVATNIGRRSWADWLDFAEGVSDELPAIVSLSEYEGAAPALPEELIEGVLRCGHKMLISGSSKAGKSFLLMELCVALANGGSWLGMKCRQGKVLYVNLEIDNASCINRFINIYKALGKDESELTNADNISIWNLRGHAVPLTELVPKIVRRIKNEGYEAVIIDPIYKVITGDENNASDMAAFCNQFDKICNETGCSVIYCHHHSKGAQGSKRAIDRASGSGVFARDPDAQLDMIQLELSDEMKYIIGDSGATAWRMESSLREFANFKPINFWFEFPVHRVDNEHLHSCHTQGSASANLEKSSKRTSAEERKLGLDTAFDACQENGMCKLSDMADFLEVATRTVKRYVQEFEDEYSFKNGIVYRVE